MSLSLPAEGRYGPAPIERRTLAVSGRREVGPYAVLTVEDPGGPDPAPGQFYMLATAGRWGGGADERPFLPRAISVMDAREGQLDFMLDPVGPGSRELCEARPGDRLLVLGPLGRGFRPPGEATPVICAGGIGVAPMVLLSRRIAGPAPVLLGFRDHGFAEAAGLFPGAEVATDDGSAGTRGSAVDLLEPVISQGPVMVYACGPAGMLEAVRGACASHSAGAQLALESGMACGYGACYGCVVALAGGGYARLCVDGPVLDGGNLADGWAAAYG